MHTRLPQIARTSAFLLAVAFAQNADAPPSADPTKMDGPNALVSTNQKSRTMLMTLPYYLKKVTEGARDLRGARYDVETTLASFHEYRDSFSPMLTAGYTYAVPSSTNLTISNQSFNVGVNKVFSETGTVLAANYTGTWSYNSGLNTSFKLGQNTISIPAVAPANSWKSQVSATVSQSLLRGGFLGFIGADQMESLRNLVRLQRTVYNSRAAGTVLQALIAYWSYEINGKLRTLSEESIKDARDLLERNRRRVALGTVDITQIYSSEMNMTAQLNQKDSLERDLLNGKANMLYLMGITNRMPDELNVVFASPLEFEPVELDEAALFETASKNRNELKQAELLLENARLAKRMAHWALLPKLDASLTVGMTAYDTNNNSFDDSLKNFNSTNYTNGVDLVFGLKFETPLDLVAYKTVVEKRNAEYDKALENLRQLRDQLRLQIRTHIGNLSYLRQVLDRSKEALDVSDRKVAELRRQFYNGKINSTDYLRGYDDQRNIQRTYYATLLQYQIEKNSLWVTQGVFLKNYGLTQLDAAAVVP